MRTRVHLLVVVSTDEIMSIADEWPIQNLFAVSTVKKHAMVAEPTILARLVYRDGTPFDRKRLFAGEIFSV